MDVGKSCGCSKFYFYGDCSHERGSWKPPRPPKPPKPAHRKSIESEGDKLMELITDESIADVNQKRSMAVREIVTTEKTYYSRLKGAWDVYIMPLQELAILGDEDISTLFFMWETLMGIHKGFSERLDSELEAETLRIGPSFNAYSHYFKMYQPYLNNFSRACDRRGVLLISDRKFSEFCQERRRDSRCDKQSLMDLMIEPVQRIPRYILLLERALKYTPSDHPERKDMEDALVIIKGVAETNNAALAKSEEMRENQDKILEVMMSFTWTTRINLLDNPTRRLLLEGPLMRQTRKSVREFQFWLFSDKLLYGEALPGTDGIFMLHRDIDLTSCRAAIPPPRHTCPDIERAIYIESSQKSFIAWGASEEEKTLWLTTLKDAIEKNREELRKLNHGDIAPMWTPNSASHCCECCEKEFSMVVFRHHCRKCGDVVCADCSMHTFMIPHINAARESRVCDRCLKRCVEDSEEYDSVTDYLVKKEQNSRRNSIYGSMKSLLSGKKSPNRLEVTEKLPSVSDDESISEIGLG